MCHSPDYLVFVNSTDSYSDCWYPFFYLFAKYWPDKNTQIMLNSDTKLFSYPGFQIQPGAQLNPHSYKMNWSELTKAGLQQINANYILYTQEDYFLNANANVALIDEFIQYMAYNNISTISLVEFSNHGPFKKTTHPLLWEVARCANYRISLQAALWNKNDLIKYLRRHENPWQFEIYGSRRARRYNDKFYCINREYLKIAAPIYPYEPTGIIKGKWKKNIVDSLFIKEGINLDFTIRGFYEGDKITQRANLDIKKILHLIKSYF